MNSLPFPVTNSIPKIISNNPKIPNKNVEKPVIKWSVKMNSLPFPVTNSIPKIISNPKIPNKNVEKPVIKWSKHKPKISASVEQLNENHHHPKVVLFKRRDGVGLGLCIGIVDAFLQLLPQPAACGAAVDAAAVAAEGPAAPCELTVSPSGLGFCDKVVGKGPEAVKGQLIKAHYVGKLENGTVFDSSYNRGKPLTFRIGVGEVIKGWDLGILGGDGVPPMLAGGKRTLRLPPELGYGMRGAGCKGGSCIIPPNSVLLFDVEFIGKA